MTTIKLEKSVTSTNALLRLLYSTWSNRWLGFILALGVAATIGLLTALTLPRGPTTTAQAFVVLTTGLTVGVIAGLALQSRWAMLVAPLAYIIVLELGRWSAYGPTVDFPRFDSAYGILALILGRGFHALVGLLPIMLGVGFGLTLARYLSNVSVRWTPSVIAALILAVLVVWLALPARTPVILGSDGKPLPGSIAELATVKLGGHNQAIMIRGYSVDNPVLLYLSGGPGQSDLPYSRVMFENLSRDFTIVSWDQRGTGKSYAALEPTSTLTLEQAVSDTVELTNYLRKRFDEEKIYMLGESWGTTLGVLAVQQHPELYYAWIGSGQMVSQRETDRRLYQDVLNLAEQKGNEQLAARMRSYGEPPYADIPYANAFVMGQYDALYQPYTPPRAYIERGTSVNLGPWGIFGSEYNLVEKVNVLRGLIDMFSVMYPQLQDIDFRKDVKKLELPVYILDGAAELTSRRDLVLEWFDLLEAPSKQLFTFENAAHSVAFEGFESVHKIMTETVLPETVLPETYQR
jgi:proline iminopeptidase